MPPFTIVLPCYNPLPGWENKVLEGYKAVVERTNAAPELIIVNDGSSKQISETGIRFLEDNIPHFRLEGYTVNKGKGAAVRYGVEKASNEIIIFTDIDFPYSSESFEKIWSLLQNGNDIVIGIKDKNYYNNVPEARIYISKILKRFSKLFLNIPVTDTQCGLKGFNAKGKAVFLSTTINRYLCDLEFVYKSYKTTPRLNIVTQEIQLRNGIQFSKMNFKVLVKELFNFLKLIIHNKR